MTDAAAHETPGQETPAQETVVHLRGAALELIAAARALLDLTEEVVKDPGPLLALAASVAAAAKAAAPTSPVPDRGASDDERRPPRVQHIRVS